MFEKLRKYNKIVKLRKVRRWFVQAMWQLVQQDGTARLIY